MPRMIDADALLDIVEQQGYVTVDDIINAETIEVPQWIPVTERLPEFEQNVHVANAGSGYVGLWSFTKDEDGDCWEDGAGWRREIGEVTHWMPLQQPPWADGGSGHD